MATTRKTATKTAATPAPKRRTAQESAEAIALAVRLRDRGVPGPIIVTQLQQRLGMSRATAYRTLARANEQRSADGGISAPPQFTEVRRMLTMGLSECFANALEDGDLKDIARVSKELREVLKMGGIGEHHEQEQQETMVHQTYARNGDPKGSDNR